MTRIFKNYLNLKLIYAIVFITLAFWSFFAYFTMNKLIHEQEVYAKIINLSGKQRMLSQKTTLIAKRFYESKNEDLKKHLIDLINWMRKDHTFIISNLTSKNTKDIYFKKPYNLDDKVNIYFKLLDDFYKTDDLIVLKEIESYSFTLLPKLDYAVNVFEKESETTINNLLKREFYILIGTLLTLLFEALFIVIPSIKIADRKEKELKDLNDSLKEKIEKAIEENSKKDLLLKQKFHLAQMAEMISNIAHHWRQPLSVISSIASGLKLKEEIQCLEKDELRNGLKEIVDKTQNLSKTISNFEEFIRSDNIQEDFVLKDKIEAIICIVESSLQNKNITLKTIIPKEQILIHGDSKSFTEVILNILNNAQDALVSNETNINKEITLEIKKLDDKVIINIENNGIGIPENIIDKIFDIYFTTKHQSQGTGLGLYICYEIIKNNFNGDLYAENIQNGVRFSIVI